MATAKVATTTDSSTSAIVLWTNRGLEALWLLTVALVPVVFFRPENFVSEAVIAYVEVPKIALLRTLVGLMTVLWLVEWGLLGKLPFSSLRGGQGLAFQPRAWRASLAAWLRGQPTRWVVLAVLLFLASTLLSTALSPSFSVSLWGEVPGQDGFPAYIIISYVLLFGVIASHLRTPAQLWRLLGAIVVAGVLVAGYAVLQNYGQDFLGVLEATGGGKVRATSIMGNAVFAGAAMLMPIAVTLMLVTISVSKLAASIGSPAEVKPKLIFLAVLGLWVLVLAVQLLGIIFTFSRGPWLGTILALVGFLALAAVLVGRRAAGWASLVLGMAGGVTWLAVQGSNILSLSSAGPGLLVSLLLVALAVVGAVFGRPMFLVRGIACIGSSLAQPGLAVPGSLGRKKGMVLASGMAVGLTAALIGLLLFSGNGGPLADSSGASPSGRSTPTVQERFASITGEVATGSFSQRGLIWQASWRIMQQVTWFEFDNLSLPWLRPIFGYGPDMFRYVFLQESVPQSGNLLPMEPDHAHNYFIHQAVEQGVFGLLTSLGLFAAVLGAGGYLLLRARTQNSAVYKLVLIGLLAVMAGRLLEQMVGVARVSDLTMFWALLAVFVALPAVMPASRPAEQEAPAQGAQTPRRRDRRRSQPPTPGYSWQRFVRLALVAWAVGGIIGLTWVKTISYPRAGVAAADAVQHFQRGDYQAAVAGLERSSELAPDVPVYYIFKSSVYAAYLQAGQTVTDRQCRLSADATTPYEICVAHKIYFSNLEAVEQRPFYWRSRLALANTALALGRDEEALRLYQETVALVPGSWPLHNRLAEAYIDTGQPRKALDVLDQSLAITGDSANSEQARDLQKVARQKLDEAAKTLPVP